MASSDLSINSMNALSNIGSIISKPTLECGFGYELIYLPYILETNRKPLRDYISNLYKEYYTGMFTTQEVKKRIIFSHNDISGIRYGQYESKSGFNVEEISSSCDLYINGHLHNQQQINEKILNLGNLTGQNFSEDSFKYSHCAAILDTDTLDLQLIDNPYALNFYKIELHTLEDFKQLDTLLDNAVLSIKINETLLPELKCRLNNKKYNFLEYRIITIPNSTVEASQSIKEIVKLDYIDQFKQYIVDQLGKTHIVEDELSKL